MRAPKRTGRRPVLSTTRPLAGALVAFLLVGAFAAASAQATGTQSKLASAKDRLAGLEQQIAAENQQLHGMQGKMNGLASRIDSATGVYQETQQQVMTLRDKLAAAEGRYDALRNELNLRAAVSYMEGPGTGLELILGSTSLTNFTDRLEYLSSVQQHDTDLAAGVELLAEQLGERQAAVNKLLGTEAAVLDTYNTAQDALNAQFQAEEAIRADLSRKQAQVGALVQRLKSKLLAEELAAAQTAQQSGTSSQTFNIKDNPLHACPVGEPHAFGDSFGAPRYAGGYHPHMGNDIMAPRGTPIYATFDGTAEADPNGLGGNAVIVRGADGYTYNAHLDSYGTLGPVKTGDIVGYVGDSGDAQGGPTHDHFEWHPNVLPSPLWNSPYGYTDISGAVDPYPYLLQVC